MFHIQKPENNVLSITPEFDLDISHMEKIINMKEQILKYISEQDIKIIILNLKHCKFIDSSGLSQMLKIYEKIQEKKGKIFVCNIDKNIKNFFDITNLSIYFIPQKNCDDINHLISKL